MSYAQFHEYCPEIAEKETRSITILEDASWKLPTADYGFVEMFCNDPGCDCRRVMFMIMSSLDEQPKAVIAYGWEKKKFYVKWFRDTDPRVIKDLMGPVLNQMSPQSELAPELLKLFKDILLKDKDYMQRVKTHYSMMREKVDKPKPKRNGLY
jgi:hypothetical protein